ncbi:ATP-binding cassette domain-containing protein [Lactobacillus sp. S2-2]|uniref:ABC transporter ATP-binding protein n=1 Tax=Lactobacillus sp. S2-2 TaxID=2692917 RepID=UPI001F36E8B6|nr:ABC transporter ATP-binding protein [Lactobacillus sp. S2-2]MCF6514619.1 ATP-binding cassette domain-containing protein [Lactobacillus sp. S2-2]
MTNILEVNNLNKSYGKRKALFDVNFNIEPGKIVGLIGPNGAGKSTIMKTIVGLTNYTTGSIKIDGENLTPTRRKALDNVGTMIETPGIYGYLTGYQHLKLFAEKGTTEADIQDIMKKSQMDSFANRKAKGYSLGMKQRLGIALSLLNHPKLLILDEPMNALDPQSTHDLRDLLVNLANEGIGILISSHLLDELERIADDYVIINNGRVLKQAPATEFLSSKGNSLTIKTNNDKKAFEVLQAGGVETELTDKLTVKYDNSGLNEAMIILVKYEIKILDIEKDQTDLETSLLSILTSNNKEEK